MNANLSTRTTAFSGFYCFSNTVADSTTQPTPELYELPVWVKFSENPTSPNGDYDEDFVIPSLAPWVDGHLIHPTPKFVITPTS
ncbi:pentatricopeptide repeat-containing protein [Arachis hypogaea]|nr:pentatricopeptide repeat-containing protein [Arachis hypogaea]